MRFFYYILSLTLIISTSARAIAQDENEETYAISLTRTAETNKEIVELDQEKVLVEHYEIQEGDHLWQLLRKRGLLKKRSLPQIISVLKKLNRSLENIDLIHPGQKILIPLVISPVKGTLKAPEKVPEVAASIETLKSIDLENFTVSPGDSLIKIVLGRYDIPEKDLYDEYLELLKKMNPEIENLNTIYPGQKIKLPIYSPQVVRAPIERKDTKGPEKATPAPLKKEKPDSLIDGQLGEIISLIGEEWVNSGQHFIPLKSGGQIKLKADSFPIINLSTGNRIIVDLYDDLPEKMARLISSSWEDYRIVHILKDDGLNEALDKIFAKCGYRKVYKAGEPLKLGGDVPLEITADWLIAKGASSGNNGETVAITMINDPVQRTPEAIGRYIGGLGIKLIEYPLVEKAVTDLPGSTDILHPGDGASELIAALLDLTGYQVSKKIEISVYQSQKTDFNLIIKADFLFNVNGMDHIIDLTGLGPEILSLLKEHRFLVLSLAGEKDPLSIVSKTLEFLGVNFEKGPHQIMATNREASRNIKITIPGTVFMDRNQQTIFASPLKLSDDLMLFLSQKGYKILQLPVS